MLKNNLCCRIYPVVILLISALISFGILYLKEATTVVKVFSDRGTFFDFLGIAFAIAVLPVALFYYLSDKEKFEKSARPLSMLGFIPALIYMGFLIF
ncbi:hypothetical protein SLH46_16335 [Draconibacterium sp. IB214405]|uniref:hypothetical protein n=1 Tax=Draconibacterium sp. IB214405 TaxID=3097352 RepID=UPI002A0AF662|nr:hypothetical protein [Draconibacterium sp. IB214405]MDX8340766.1 hypothetical protein [Draconibacterium sp. IB214405]